MYFPEAKFFYSMAAQERIQTDALNSNEVTAVLYKGQQMKEFLSWNVVRVGLGWRRKSLHKICESDANREARKRRWVMFEK